MANRKSSITAELRLTGQAAFKSGLKDIEGAAGRTGKALMAVKPITFDGGANQARTQFARMEEHQRAHHRVLQRQAKENAARVAALGPTGKGASGGRDGAGSGVRRLSMAYNFGQDFLQGGGLRGIANNIPQIVEEIAASPQLKGIMLTAGAAAAAAAATGLAGKLGYDLYQNTGSRFDEKANKRYFTNKEEADKKKAERDREQSLKSAGTRGDAASTNQAGYGSFIDSGIDQHERRSSQLSEIQQQESALRRARIDGIEDPAERARATAEEEKRTLDQSVTLNRQKAQEVMRLAHAEQAAAEARYKAIRQELDAQTNASRTPQEITRRIELEKELIGLQTRLTTARERANNAGQGIEDSDSQAKSAQIQKKTIDEKLKIDLDGQTKQKEEDERAGRLEQARQIGEVQQMKRKADTELAEKEKARQVTRDELSGDVAMSKMSPRKRAKAEEARAVKEDTDEFLKQGFSKKEAEQMASDRATLRKPETPGRTRGAGYGKKDSDRATGLGSSSFDGLAGLAAMQPGADPLATPPQQQERKRITGAGRDKSKEKDKDDTTQSTGASIGAQIIARLQSLEKAVRDTGPNHNERGKPIATGSR